MEALRKNKTWEMVNLPTRKKLFERRCVFTVRYKSNGSIGRYKAKLVSKKYTQTYVINYLYTLALVAKMNTARVIPSLAANPNLQ